MLVTIYCIIGLIIFLINVMILPDMLKELPIVSNFVVLFAFIVSFFAGVLWPATIIYGICKYDEPV